MLSKQSWAPAAAMWLIVSIPHFLSLFPSSSSTIRLKGTRKTGPNFSLKDFLTSYRTGVGEVCHRSAEIFLNKLIFTRLFLHFEFNLPNQCQRLFSVSVQTIKITGCQGRKPTMAGRKLPDRWSFSTSHFVLWTRTPPALVARLSNCLD